MAPTSTLVAIIRNLEMPCELKPNGMSEETVALSAHWNHTFNLNQAWPGQFKRLGYASGTPTHEGDFGTILDSVANALSKNPDWQLTIIGALNTRLLEQRLTEELRKRIEFRPLVEHQNLAYELARCTLNLAPLEKDNPFCVAKSPLKWFEAAACGTPTLATATRTFAEAIKNEETGYLCESKTDWSNTLGKTLSTPKDIITVTDTSVYNLREETLTRNFLLPVLRGG